MNDRPDSTIRICVDPTNPGQFFACCGLLEIADRLWKGAEGWFDEGHFNIAAPGACLAMEKMLTSLLVSIAGTTLHQVDVDDDGASPIIISKPFDLLLDWWKDKRAGGSKLKVWAGRMSSIRIARAMQQVLTQQRFHGVTSFDEAVVVYDPLEQTKKVEPFYFDSRRGANALPLDIGFSPDSLQMTTVAYPVVEFFCLVGLQRIRPLSTDFPRVFKYHTWEMPLCVCLAPIAVCGILPQVSGRAFHFENAFRTDQKKHKAFTPATPIERNRQ